MAKFIVQMRNLGDKKIDGRLYRNWHDSPDCVEFKTLKKAVIVRDGIAESYCHDRELKFRIVRRVNNDTVIRGV